MRNLFNIVVLILLLGGFWYGYGKNIQESGFKAGVGSFASDVRSFINGPEVSTALEKLNTGVNNLMGSLAETLDTASEKETQETEKVKNQHQHWKHLLKHPFQSVISKLATQRMT